MKILFSSLTLASIISLVSSLSFAIGDELPTDKQGSHLSKAKPSTHVVPVKGELLETAMSKLTLSSEELEGAFRGIVLPSDYLRIQNVMKNLTPEQKAAIDFDMSVSAHDRVLIIWLFNDLRMDLHPEHIRGICHDDALMSILMSYDHISWGVIDMVIGIKEYIRNHPITSKRS